MISEPVLTHDLVLLGGGHAHALVLRQWGMDRLDGVRLTLVNPSPMAPYTGMLPGHVAGHYRREALDMDLVRLARFAGARLVIDRAVGIDRDEKRVHLSARAPIRYDLLSIDIGITASLPTLPGFREHAHSVKPLGPFATAWDEFVERVRLADTGAGCAVIGGGVAGVETALAMAQRLGAEGVSAAKLTLIEAGEEILAGLGTGARRRLKRQLAAFGVETITGVQPVAVIAGGVMLDNGRNVPADFVLSAAGARPHDWLGAVGLAHTGGFIDVRPTLQTTTDPSIFAVGDCGHMAFAPRPKAGVYAVRQAPILYRNLRAAVKGERLETYRPQRDYLKIISMGSQTAVAEKYGMSLSGGWLWRWKDRIDQKFMAQFRHLPDMQGAMADDMLCGGCGAKVSQPSLRKGLAMVEQPGREDILLGIGGDAAVLFTGGARQVIAVDHLRAFTDDPWMLARIAAVHALGDIWAMGAAPQSGLLSVILPRMSEAMQAATIAEITHAAQAVLREAGAGLVGGHTSLGAELTIGLTVTGLCSQEPIGLNGARPGDRLILTRPIGTGVILAAEMRKAAKGRDVAAALDSMSRPQSRASAILAPVANAMTDVTGFGLAGHLMSILDGSGLEAEIDLDAVPVLSGAEALVASGVKSSIWQANSALAEHMTPRQCARRDLLFDPQTAGGLLACVPEEQASAVLDALLDAGETAALIGRLRPGEPFIHVKGA